MKQTAIPLCFIVITLTSCKQRNENKFMNDVADSIQVFKRNIVTKGDTNSYYKLRVLSLEEGSDILLPYALLMANKYHYQSANYDVYLSLKAAYNGVDSLDSVTKAMQENYLSRSGEQP